MPAKAGLITLLTLDRTLCPECISSRAGVDLLAVEYYLHHAPATPTKRVQAARRTR